MAILFPTRLEALEARDALERLNDVASIRQVFSAPPDAGAEEVLRLWSLLSDADRKAVLEVMRAAAMEAHGE